MKSAHATERSPRMTGHARPPHPGRHPGARARGMASRTKGAGVFRVPLFYKCAKKIWKKIMYGKKVKRRLEGGDFGMGGIWDGWKVAHGMVVCGGGCAGVLVVGRRIGLGWLRKAEVARAWKRYCLKMCTFDDGRIGFPDMRALDWSVVGIPESEIRNEGEYRMKSLAQLREEDRERREGYAREMLIQPFKPDIFDSHRDLMEDRKYAEQQ